MEMRRYSREDVRNPSKLVLKEKQEAHVKVDRQVD